MPADSPSRRNLYEGLQIACAGEKVEDVLGALCDSLTACVGFIAEDLEAADRLIDSLPADLKRNLRENWDYLRAARAGGEPMGTA